MRVLTHGTLERKTLSGRVTDVWPGATAVFSQKAQDIAANNVMNRGGMTSISHYCNCCYYNNNYYYYYYLRLLVYNIITIVYIIIINKSITLLLSVSY